MLLPLLRRPTPFRRQRDPPEYRRRLRRHPRNSEKRLVSMQEALLRRMMRSSTPGSSLVLYSPCTT